MIPLVIKTVFNLVILIDKSGFGSPITFSSILDRNPFFACVDSAQFFLNFSNEL